MLGLKLNPVSKRPGASFNITRNLIIRSYKALNLWDQCIKFLSHSWLSDIWQMSCICQISKYLLKCKSDDPSMDELHAKLGICDLAILVQERRLRWFGHVMRSNGEINRVRSRPVPGRKGPGRPKKTWEECVKQDLKVCGLSEAGTQDRLSWRSSVKNSRQEPTPSNGSLPQSMAAPPARRVLGMRTRSFNKTGFDWLIDLTLLMLETEYSGFWGSIPCLLMPWLLKSPGHQQAVYWLCRTDDMYCCSRVNFIYLGQAKSKIQFKMWIYLL